MSKKKDSRSKVTKRQTAGVISSQPNSSAVSPPHDQADRLLADLCKLIESARQRAATEVNSTMVMLYWHIGERIRSEILGGQRAVYGKQIVATVALQLTAEYGDSYSEKYLRKMMRFAEVYCEQEIVASLMRQLSWTHFLELIPVKDDLKRAFYAEMCRIERWSVRTLRSKIQSMLYERTAISKKPEERLKRSWPLFVKKIE